MSNSTSLLLLRFASFLILDPKDEMRCQLGGRHYMDLRNELPRSTRTLRLQHGSLRTQLEGFIVVGYGF